MYPNGYGNTDKNIIDLYIRGEKMDKELLGDLLIKSLSKHNFKNYGNKLFYLDLKDSIIILKQLTYMTCAELYINFIIKECHPEIKKITKNVLKDEMLIDNFTLHKLYYDNGKEYNFYKINESAFQEKIDEIYNNYVKPFQISFMEGLNNLYNITFNDKYDFTIQLYKDSARKIGHPEFAGYRGHDWLVSDEYLLSYVYRLDSRYINNNTAKYIMDNILKKAPNDLKGKALTKWCDEKCKEIFISKSRRRDFGWKLILPLYNGKPLKYLGIDKQSGNQIYSDEETNEVYHCIITDKTDLNDIKYELHKIK